MGDAPASVEGHLLGFLAFEKVGNVGFGDAGGGFGDEVEEGRAASKAPEGRRGVEAGEDAGFALGVVRSNDGEVQGWTPCWGGFDPEDEGVFFWVEAEGEAFEEGGGAGPEARG